MSNPEEIGEKTLRHTLGIPAYMTFNNTPLDKDRLASRVLGCFGASLEVLFPASARVLYKLLSAERLPMRLMVGAPLAALLTDFSAIPLAFLVQNATGLNNNPLDSALSYLFTKGGFNAGVHYTIDSVVYGYRNGREAAEDASSPPEFNDPLLQAGYIAALEGRRIGAVNKRLIMSLSPYALAYNFAQIRYSVRKLKNP